MDLIAMLKDYYTIIEDNMIYLTSDQHFGHTNIIKYAGRPFGSLEEMDSTMIERWNEKVSEKDIVIHLGDFGLSNSTRLKEIIGQLNGRKIIILGNHDKSVTWYMNNGFEQAYKGEFVVNGPWATLERGTALEKVILTHCPVHPSSFCCLAPRTNVHGHIHEKAVDISLMTVAEYENNNYINVSVEQHNYYPMSLEELGLEHMRYWFHVYIDGQSKSYPELD